MGTKGHSSEPGSFRLPGMTAEMSGVRRDSRLADPVSFGDNRLHFPDFTTGLWLTIPDEFPQPSDYVEPPPAEPAERGADPAYRKSLMLAVALAIPDSMLPGARTPSPDQEDQDDAPVVAPPQQSWVLVELRCRNRAERAGTQVIAASLTPSAALPQFALEPDLEGLDELAGQCRRPGRPAIQLPKREGQKRISANASRAIKAAAAGIVVLFSLWFGSGTLLPGSGERASTAAEATPEQTASGGTQTTAQAVRNTVETKASAPGPMGWVRSALAERAAVEIRDTFDHGMQSWGSKEGTLPEGWSRSREGYLRIGALALFQPSMALRDYSLEFFGQIETKSMGWVVRAQDKENYYAMKFKVLHAGLRPIIAIEHYPVVGGKKGRRMEVPLNVMVHNDTPYHVAVAVKGNKFTTSIEGQEVDSWTDDTLAEGGIGFFSEAGESARLYWMRVMRNQDFWGKVCAYVSGAGNGPGQTAQTAPAVPPAGLPSSRPDWKRATRRTAAVAFPCNPRKARGPRNSNQDRLPA